MCDNCRYLSGVDRANLLGKLGYPQHLVSPLVQHLSRITTNPAKLRAQSQKATNATTVVKPKNFSNTLVCKMQTQAQVIQQLQHTIAEQAATMQLQHDVNHETQCKLAQALGSSMNRALTIASQCGTIQTLEHAVTNQDATIQSLQQNVMTLQHDVAHLTEGWKMDKEDMLARVVKWEARATHAHESEIQLKDALKARDTHNTITTSTHLLLEGGEYTKAQQHFFQGWFRRASSRGAHLTSLLRELAILASFEFSERTYNLFKPFLGLSSYDHAINLRKKHSHYTSYKTGNNPLAWEKASSLFSGQGVLITDDGTRVPREVGLLHGLFLVGVCFPPDVADWPLQQDVVPEEMAELTQYLGLARSQPTLLAHDLNTTGVHSTTGSVANFLPTVFFPEPTFGFTAKHHARLVLQCSSWAWNASLRSFGHCADSCSTFINAIPLIMLPNAKLMQVFNHWIGIDIPQWKWWTPLLAVRKLPSGNMEECWLTLYTEFLHCERNFRKAFKAHTRQLLTSIGEDLTLR
jgi:uncharacterized coiled-coil protein SlyX